MITIVGRWESGWLDPKVELFMFRQLKGAFHFDRLVMVPKLLSERVSVDQYDTMEEALKTVQGKKVFLEPKGMMSLNDFKRDEDVVYILGCAGTGNMHLVTDEDISLRIPTPGQTDIFAVNAVSILLARDL